MALVTRMTGFFGPISHRNIGGKTPFETLFLLGNRSCNCGKHKTPQTLSSHEAFVEQSSPEVCSPST